jgi:tetrahydromethanopterin S-methyltransferase subunit G
MLHLQLEDNGQFELLEDIVPNQAYRQGGEPRSKSIHVNSIVDTVTGIETHISNIEASIDIIEDFTDNEEINKMVDDFVDWRNEKSSQDWDNQSDDIEWIAYQNEEEHRCREIENRVHEINNKIFERLGKKFDLVFTVLKCKQWESLYTTEIFHVEGGNTLMNVKSDELSFRLKLHITEPPKEKKSIWKSAINYLKKFNEDIDWGTDGIENWTPKEFSDMVNLELEDNKQFEIVEIHFSAEPYILRPSEDVIGQEIQIIESFTDDNKHYIGLVIDTNKKIFEKLGKKYDFTISEISCRHIVGSGYKITFNIYFK